MAYLICASTPETSVAVVRREPLDALDKIKEFEDAGVTQVAVTEDGLPITSEQLLHLVARDGPAPANA